MFKLYPLSLPQRDIYYEQLLFPGKAIYTIGGKVEVYGNLDPVIFEKAVRQLIQQHDSLRSNIIIEDGKPFVKIPDYAEAEIGYRDFSVESDSLISADKFIKEEFRRPFDLNGSGSLSSYFLLKISKDLFFIFGKFHHLVVDGWAISLLFSRLSNLYALISSGRQVSGNDIFLYTDFIEDDLNYLACDEYLTDELYWKKKFEVFGEPSFFDSHNSLIAGSDLKNNRKEIYLERNQYNELIGFCETNSISVFHFLIGVFYVYFSSFVQDRRLILGLPLLNRKNKKFKNTVGLFAGISPLLLAIGDDRTFIELVREIRNDLRESFRHQRFPLSTIISNAKLLRGDNSHPAYHLFFSYEKHDYSIQFDGYPSKVVPLTHQLERVPLAIYVREFDNVKDVRIDFEYNVNFFDASFIDTCTDRFQSLVTELLQNPDVRIGDIGLMSREEEYRLVHDFNDTERDYADKGTVPELFAEQVLRVGNKTAVEYEGFSLSYLQLDERSNCVAHYLRVHHGVGRDDLVGMLLGRSAEMLIGMLGILKSGGAYVPIDPDHPESRILYILDQSKVKVILTEGRYAKWLEEKGYKVMEISSENKSLGEYAGMELRYEMKAEDVMYVMYTSGSTGRPKGVEISHGSVVNFLLSMQEKLGINESERLLAVTTYSFDISVLELLGPLISGGTVILTGREKVQDASLLAKSITDVQPSMMQCTPAMWQMLLDGGWKGDKSIRALCGGERLSKDLAVRLLDQVKELWNMYGPTETTIWSSMRQVFSEEDASNIGYPIANTDIYILGNNYQLLPVGIAGEIYIGGAGLARGYKDHPELTAEKFIAHPFKSAERLYRTGDMGKRHSEGSIEFLGRKDEQVKIRGYRVEPAEIEGVLLKHNNVSAALVTSAEGSDGINYLVGYVVLSSATTSGELREYVKKELPDYMVPGYFIELTELPLSANGKVDRKSLPAIKEEELEGSSEYRVAGNRLESELVRIWEDVLNREHIGIRDNFFEIGGHSLRAVQILSRIQKELKVELGLHDLFNNPRIEELGRIIKQKDASGKYEEIKVIEEREYYELSHAQRRLWILSWLPQGSLAYNIAGAYILKGSLDIESFNRSLLTVVQRHESLRTIFITVDGVPMQKIVAMEQFGFSLDQQDIGGTGNGELAEQLALEELETAFDLSRGPLIRARLLKTGEEEHVFLLTLHHIITDGWSMEVIVKELITLYECYRYGHPNPLPPLRIQYKDYAHWQNEQIKSNRIEDDRRYWLEQFSGEIPVLELPADYPRPEILSHRGGSITGLIDGESYCRMLELTSHYETSAYNILMSLVNVLLYRYTAQTDIIVGCPISTRDNAELENQVGFYLNTIALRTKIEGNDSFTDVLGKIKGGMIAAHSHKLYPFDKLIASLGMTRNTGRSPLFDVVVVLQNLQIHKEELNDAGGIAVETYPVELAASSVDLRLEFIERAGYFHLNFEYNKSLFKASTIQLFMDRFLSVLVQVFEDTAVKVEDLVFENDKALVGKNNFENHFTVNF